MNKYIFTSILITLSVQVYLAFSSPDNSIIWRLGEADNRTKEFALSPDDFKDFLKNDFGWEDNNFIVGTSEISTDWPYTLPGPSDDWGGTSGTAGWRSHVLNVLFDVKNKPAADGFNLIVDVFDFNTNKPPLIKISMNGKSWNYQLPTLKKSSALPGADAKGNEFIIEIPLENGIILHGGNEFSITSLQGSWFMFDQIRLEGPSSTELRSEHLAFIRKVNTADYEIQIEENDFQPLLIDVEHVEGSPGLKVMLDGEIIFSENH